VKKKENTSEEERSEIRDTFLCTILVFLIVILAFVFHHINERFNQQGSLLYIITNRVDSVITSDKNKDHEGN